MHTKIITICTILLTIGLHPTQTLSAATEESDLTPVNFPVKDTGKTGMDLSSLNHTPAGKYGFIRTTQDGHFANDQGRTKFLGIALVGSLCLPNREDADKIATYLAKNGINMVRFHFFMNYLLTKNASNASKSFAALDYFLYALMQRGIYIDLDLYDLYQVNPPGITPDGGRFKANDFFYYSKAIEAQKYYTSLLFNHINPHTKRAYKDEPGIAFTELLNENTPFWQDGLQKTTGEAKTELETHFINWIKNNNVPESHYKPLLTDKEKPLEAGNITFGSVFDTEVMKQFAVSLMLRYYKEMGTYLKSIGVRIPVTGHNSPFTVADFYTLSKTMDYTCSHFYWTHGDISSLKMPLNHFWTLAPQLNRIRVASMPAIVNEFSYSHPNKYRSEGLPELMAYAGLQDLDALVLFSFHDEWPKFTKDGKLTGGSWKTPNMKLRYHSNLAKDPAIWPLVPAFSLSFRQSLVSPAKYNFNLTYNENDASNREVREKQYSAGELQNISPDSFGSRQLLASSEETYKKLPALVRGYDPLDISQLLAFTSRVSRKFVSGKGGMLYNAATGSEANAIDANALRITYLPDANNANFTSAYNALANSLETQNIRLPKISANSIFSDTNEIERNYKDGILRIETPHLLVISGFIKGNNTFLDNTLALSVESEHLSAAIVAGDTKDLRNAAAVYICFGVNAANSGQQPTVDLKDFHIGQPYKDGDTPILADPLTASLVWHRSHSGYSIYMEDPDTAEYQLLKEESARGETISITFKKNAYRYKIIIK